MKPRLLTLVVIASKALPGTLSLRTPGMEGGSARCVREALVASGYAPGDVVTLRPARAAGADGRRKRTGRGEGRS